MLGINSLHGNVNVRWRITAQINRIAVVLVHIAVQEIATGTIGVGIGTQYVTSTWSSSYAQCVCQIHGLCLSIMASVPIYHKPSVFIYCRRFARSIGCCIGYGIVNIEVFF